MAEPYATGGDGTKYWHKADYTRARERLSNNAQHRRRRILG